MTDKEEYVEAPAPESYAAKFAAAEVSNHSGSATHIPESSIEENLEHEMEHETKEQAVLDIEMAKGKVSKTEPESRRWVVLATATLGALFVSLQGSALIVALPDLMQNLNVRVSALSTPSPPGSHPDTFPYLVSPTLTSHMLYWDCTRGSTTERALQMALRKKKSGCANHGVKHNGAPLFDHFRSILPPSSGCC